MKKQFSLLVLMILSVGFGFAQTAETRKKQFNLEESGLAIQGYDPVSYFDQHKAVEGKKEIAAVYNGVVYRFSSKQNREMFTQNPTQYEPQYGGWCAYAMGQKGEKVEVDPKTYKIVDGKLYLFYNKYFNNTLKSWNQNEQQLKSQADQNWMKFIP